MFGRLLQRQKEKEPATPSPAKTRSSKASPVVQPILKSPGSSRTSSSASGSVCSSGSSGRRVRFSDSPEIQEAAGASPAPHAGGSGRSTPHASGGARAGRPPRSPPSALRAIPSEAGMSDGPTAAPAAGAAGAAAPAAGGERAARAPARHHRPSSAQPQQQQQAASEHRHRRPPEHRHHHHQRSPRHAADVPPPPEEVAAAVGPGGEGEGQPGSLAECARLFHKYKDPKRGLIGVDGFGRLLERAGRLDGLRSPIARAACVKREMAAADASGNGWVSWAEFSRWFPSFQQQHYTQQRNHFYEEKGKEAEEAAAAAAAAATAAARAAEEEAAAERAARKARAIAARAAAKRAWEEAQRAAAAQAAAEARAAAHSDAHPETPPSAAAVAAATAAAAAATAGPAPASMEGLSDEQLASELQRLELAAAGAAAQLEAARSRAAARLAGGGSAEGLAEASGAGSSLGSSAAATAAAGTPQPSPALAARGGAQALDGARLRRLLQRETLQREAAAAAAAAASAEAAAAAAEAAAAAAEAEEAAAADDAAAAEAAAANPDLQRVFAAFAAFGKGTAPSSGAAPQLDHQQFAKLCRDARLVGGGLTLGRADIIFTRVAGKGGSRMSYRQFAAALPLLARQRGCAPADAAALVAACPGPQLNSELGGTGRQSSFTGRAGSAAGSRPASVAGSELEAGAEAGADDDARSVGSHGGGRQVGGFVRTPTRRSRDEGPFERGPTSP